MLDFLQDVLCGDRRRYDVPDQLNPDQRRRFCKEIKGILYMYIHIHAFGNLHYICTCGHLHFLLIKPNGME